MVSKPYKVITKISGDIWLTKKTFDPQKDKNICNPILFYTTYRNYKVVDTKYVQYLFYFEIVKP